MKATKDKNSEIVILNELAILYKDINIAKSIEYVDKIEKLLKKNTFSYDILIDVYRNLGEIYYFSAKIKKAIEYYELELELIKQIGTERQILEAKYNIATLYFKSDDMKNAETYYKDISVIAEQIKDEDFKMLSYQALYVIYLKQKKHEQALIYFNKYIEIKDK